MKKLLMILVFIAARASYASSWPPNFTIVSIPDYQFISSGCLSSQFTSVVNWISANKTTLNILAVIGEGDSVDTPSTAQWNCFSTYFLTPLISLGIPVIVTPGNHDYDPQLPITNGNPSWPAGRSLTLWTTNVLTPIQAQSAYQANWVPGATGLSIAVINSAGSGQTPGTYSVTGTCSGVTGCSCTTQPVISVTVAAGGTVTATPTVTTAGSCSGTVSPAFTLSGTGGTAAILQGALLGAEAPAAYWIELNDAGYLFGIISLGYCPLSGEVTWAQGIMSANSSIPFAVLTHAYTYASGSTQPSAVGALSSLTSPTYACNYSNPGSNTEVYDPTVQSGANIWSDLQSSSNYFLEVNGHWTSNSPPVYTAEITETGTNGNDVPHMYFNHQQDSVGDGASDCSSGAPANGSCNSYIRILQIQPGLGQIVVTSCNPVLSTCLTDSQNSFTVPYNMPGSGLQVTAARPVF